MQKPGVSFFAIFVFFLADTAPQPRGDLCRGYSVSAIGRYFR
jgi:hypothetical protein